MPARDSIGVAASCDGMSVYGGPLRPSVASIFELG
jgi:hypothetical protein